MPVQIIKPLIGVRALVATLLFAWVPFAVLANSDLLPPQINTVTPTGISLSDGSFTIKHTDLSIGTLTLTRTYSGSVVLPQSGAPWDSSTMFYGIHTSNNFDIFVMPAKHIVAPTTYARPIVHLGDGASGMYKQFSFAAGAPVYANNIDANTGSLQWISGAYQYTDATGAVYAFSSSVLAAGVSYTTGTNYAPYAQRIASITYPDGRVRSFAYVSGRLKLVFDSTGYAIIFDWGANGFISAACGFNLAVTYVTTATTCTGASLKVTYTYSGSGNNMLASVTDVMGQTESYSYNSSYQMTCVQPPGASGCKISNSWGGGGIGQTLADGTLWAYSWTFWDQSVGGRRTEVEPYGDGNVEAQVIDPAGKTWYYTFTGSSPYLTSDPNLHGNIYSFTGAAPYDDPNWPYVSMGSFLQSVTYPEGNKYLVQNNGPYSAISRETWQAKGSGLPDIVKQYIYGGTGPVAQITKPIHVIDPKGNQTDYTYATHGGVLTETLPAASSGGIRPQKRYSYTQFYAWIKNSSGAYVQAAAPIWKLTGISECRTQASCAGTADEIKTTISYGPTGTANNLLPTVTTVGAGDNSLVATTTTTYDSAGNALTVDGPQSGTADTTRTRYDAMNRVVGVVSPDPDGASPMPNRATRNTYDAAGRLIKVERGTVNSQSDADWLAFVNRQSIDSSYDGLDRKVRETLSGGGSVYSMTQYSYDSLGHLECTAVRMDPAQWGAQPNVCTPQLTGPYGPDRISRNYYGNAGELTKVKTAVGSAIESDEQNLTYTPNGKLATITDGESNKTVYGYDPHDRLARTNYPDPANKGATLSFEQLAYDANSNITQRILRDGQTINYSFDNLNRMTLKDLPSPEIDVTYSPYDLQGHLLQLYDAFSLVYTFDALGRLKTEGGPQGTMSYDYDPAGRRIKTTWPDGFYVTQDFLVTGEVLAIRESGASSGVGVLATYAYDDLGRRTSIARAGGAGASTAYGYDGISRLSTLSHDIEGSYSGDDLTTTFSYNPASEITSTTRSNEEYSWYGHYNLNKADTVNGLNQTTGSGGTALSYDGRGNLTANGTNTYSYSAENRMLSGPSGATFQYDPAGRLYQSAKAPDTARFVYDGTDLVAEYDAAGVMKKRYVQGPGDDEPLVMYTGASTANRQWYHQDEHGSVFLMTDSASNLSSRNDFDEYGVRDRNLPLTTRFAYTGQIWLPEVDLYYYKARIYSADLGRFMQADSIGYSDGMNLYSYVGGDPVNKTDTSGNCTGSILCNGNGCSQDVTCIDGGSDGGGYEVWTKSPSHPGGNDGQTVAVRWDGDNEQVCMSYGIPSSPACDFMTRKEATVRARMYGVMGMVGAAGEVVVVGGIILIEAEGGYTIYVGVDKSGIVRYVGQTSRDVLTRASEHMAAGGQKAKLIYQAVQGGTRATLQAARKLEQQLINQYGGPKGGQLLNKINSIAKQYWEEHGIVPPP